MKIKFVENTGLLFGKIKYWQNPVFDLDKLYDFDYVRDYLQEELSLELAPIYAKPPQRGTVLGDIKHTIRTNYALFLDNSVPSLFKNLEFGFGECGYYYDIKLNSVEIDLLDFKKEIELICNLVRKFEKTIEHGISEFKFRDLMEQANPHIISNFQATISLENDYLKDKFDFINNIVSLIQNNNDRISANTKNLIFTNISFNIINETLIKSPQYLKEQNIPLVKERFFNIQKMLSEDSNWRFNSRGIPISTIISIFDLLFS
jgi:hypothetical protein